MTDFPIPALLRLRANPDRGVGVLVYRTDDAYHLWFEGALKRFQLHSAWERVERGDVKDHRALAFFDADVAALEGVNPALHAKIRHHWYFGALLQGAAFKATRSYDGRTSQNELSAYLRAAGIEEPDPRWQRIIERGRHLYRLPK